MNKQFTASKVHRLSNRIPRSNDEIADAQEALRAFAYMLEAREMAMPVRQFCVVPKGSTWTDVKDDEIWAVVTAHPESYETRVLYTHSTQAQPPAASVTDAMKRAFEHLASIGYPKNARGNYDKDGEWTFSEAVPRDVDAREVSAAFHTLKTALAAQENPNG